MAKDLIHCILVCNEVVISIGALLHEGSLCIQTFETLQ
jgi:hypothetical protein